MIFGGEKMFGIYFRNKQKVLENLKRAYIYYSKNAIALENAANELLNKSQESKEYVKKTIEKMEKYGGVVDRPLLKGYLANAKRNEENARNLMKRSIVFQAAADYVKGVHSILRYSDLGKNSPNIHLPKWVNEILNGDLPSVDEVVIDPPVTMDIYSKELDKELDSIISEYNTEKMKAAQNRNDLEKKLSEVDGM